MTWGKNTLTSKTPGQGTGGQDPTSRLIFNITPAPQVEGVRAEIEFEEEREEETTIHSDSENPDEPEDLPENPEELTAKMKEEILRKYLEEKKK